MSVLPSPRVLVIFLWNIRDALCEHVRIAADFVACWVFESQKELVNQAGIVRNDSL